MYMTLNYSNGRSEKYNNMEMKYGTSAKGDNKK
jgi:hypothetical protein